MWGSHARKLKLKHQQEEEAEHGGLTGKRARRTVGPHSRFDSIHQVAEFISFLAISATLFFGLWQYVSDSQEKGEREAEAIYDLVDQRFVEFLKLAVRYPDLDLYSVKAPPESQAHLSETQKAQQKQLHTVLIDLLENAYIHYWKPKGVPKHIQVEMRTKQWPGWEGYIKKFLGTPTITNSDIIGLESLTTKLKQPFKDDGVSQYLTSKLSVPTRSLLAKNDTTRADMEGAFVKDFNLIVNGESIFEVQRFAKVKLSAETSRLLQQNPQGADLARLNRLLLQDAYPEELSDQFIGRPAFRKTWFEIRDEYDEDFVKYMDTISPPPGKGLSTK